MQEIINIKLSKILQYENGKEQQSHGRLHQLQTRQRL